MTSSAPDPGDHSSGDARSQRSVITLADMLGKRARSMSRPGAEPVREDGCPLYAAAAGHKTTATAGVLVAIGSLVAAAALFGHVDRAGAPGQNPPPRHPGSGAPGADQPAELPGRTREMVPGTQMMRDLTTVALPTLSDLTVPNHTSRARGAGRTARHTTTESLTAADSPAPVDADLWDGVTGLVGGTVEAVGETLGGPGEPVAEAGRGARHVAPVENRGNRSIGPLSSVQHRAGRHAAPDSLTGTAVRSIGSLG